MKTSVIAILAVTVFLSCTRDEKELLRITASRKITDGNSIHNIIYTRKYVPLTDSVSLSRYLQGDELQDVLGAGQKQYFFYKDVISTADFKIIALMVKQFYKSDSAYYYQLRTYTPEGKAIDKIDFAIWDEHKNIYCSSVLKTPGAVLSESLKITKTCDGHMEVFQITKEGRFIISSAPEDGVVGSL